MRLLRTYRIVGIALMVILTMTWDSQAQNTEAFDKALKKAIKSPSNKKNKESLEHAYLELQSLRIQNLITVLTEKDNLSTESRKVVFEYFETKKAYLSLYDDIPELTDEDKLNLLFDQLTHDYYQRGAELIQNHQTKDYAKAKEYLGLVRAINPNFQNINELYNQASENAKYNILITYDLGNFPEFQPLMQQLLNEINLKIENYNTEKKTFQLQEQPNQDYQLVYKFTFNYLDLGLTNRKSSNQEFQRTVDGQIKRARVTFENYIRKSKATGAFSIFSNIENQEIEKDPFNLNFTTDVRNATISGDQDAIDPFSLRDILRMRGSEVDAELQSEAEFKRRMFQLLERHLRYDYSSSDLK